MVWFRAALSVLAVVLLAGGWLWGQQDSKTTRGRTLPLYWSKLGLSEEQKSKAAGVVGEYRKKIDDLKRQISQLEAEERAELAKILTADQKKQLQKLISSKVPGGDTDDKKDDKK